MTEQWRPVVGFEGFYEVSDHGRVRSLDRASRGSHGSTRKIKGRVLSASSGRDGRRRVQLWGEEGKQRWSCVGHLVMEGFGYPRAPGAWLLHWDDNPSNDNLSNLRWGTPSENNADAVRNGTHYQAKKTHCPQGHRFTPENTYVYRGRRNCRECRRDDNRRYYERKKR